MSAETLDFMFNFYSQKELGNLMSVVDQSLKRHPVLNEPHKIMVWHAKVANKHVKPCPNTPEGSYCVYAKSAASSNPMNRAFIEIMWDRALVVVEVVYDDEVARYHYLPREHVLKRDVTGCMIAPMGYDPNDKSLSVQACLFDLEDVPCDATPVPEEA